jgi:hypothetical protein
MTPNVSQAEIIAELEANHRRELRKLDDISFALLHATDNDTLAAERMLDDFVDLLFESNIARVRMGL